MTLILTKGWLTPTIGLINAASGGIACVGAGDREASHTFLSSFQAPRQLSGGERSEAALVKAAIAKPPRLIPEAEQRLPFFGWAAAARGVTDLSGTGRDG